MPEVIAADWVTGETDAMLMVVAREVAELQRVLVRLSTRGGAARVMTLLRLEELKPSSPLPLMPTETVGRRRVAGAAKAGGAHERTDHQYQVTVRWTGNQGRGTSGYRAYGRDHEVTADLRPAIAGSADRAFRGSAERWDPERLLVAALSQCHMLSYLHVCADSGVVVVDYVDDAEGTMQQTPDGEVTSPR